MYKIVKKIGFIDESLLTVSHVRTATFLRLPFNLRTGPLHQIIDPDIPSLEIWIRNKFSFPNGADFREVFTWSKMEEMKKSHPDNLFTNVLIYDLKPNVTEDELEIIKKGETSDVWWFASVSSSGLQLLNEIIAAHQMVRSSPYISGLNESWPRMLTEREIMNYIVVEVVLLSQNNETNDNELILSVFEFVDQFSFSPRGSGVDQLWEYSSEQIEDLEKNIRRIRKHAFYELKVNAVSAMLAGDLVVAIVLGCAALEGVHGAFMRLELRDKIPGNRSSFNQFISGLLREQGFFSLVQLSLRIFMLEEERPDENDLMKCLKGISIRNSIMHAGIKKTGKYKFRDYSIEEINEGYSGIMSVYRAFEDAVESREKW